MTNTSGMPPRLSADEADQCSCSSDESDCLQSENCGTFAKNKCVLPFFFSLTKLARELKSILECKVGALNRSTEVDGRNAPGIYPVPVCQLKWLSMLVPMPN